MVESYEQIKFRKCLQKGRICSENVCKKRQICSENVCKKVEFVPKMFAKNDRLCWLSACYVTLIIYI